MDKIVALAHGTDFQDWSVFQSESDQIGNGLHVQFLQDLFAIAADGLDGGTTR